MTVEELQDMCAGIKRGEYVPLLDDLLNGRAMIVDTNWLEKHDKQMIDKACKLVGSYFDGGNGMERDYWVSRFRKAMES